MSSAWSRSEGKWAATVLAVCASPQLWAGKMTGGERPPHPQSITDDDDARVDDRVRNHHAPYFLTYRDMSEPAPLPPFGLAYAISVGIGSMSLPENTEERRSSLSVHGGLGIRVGAGICLLGELIYETPQDDDENMQSFASEYGAIALLQVTPPFRDFGWGIELGLGKTQRLDVWSNTFVARAWYAMDDQRRYRAGLQARSTKEGTGSYGVFVEMGTGGL